MIRAGENVSSSKFLLSHLMLTKWPKRTFTAPYLRHRNMLRTINLLMFLNRLLFNPLVCSKLKTGKSDGKRQNHLLLVGRWSTGSYFQFGRKNHSSNHMAICLICSWIYEFIPLAIWSKLESKILKPYRDNQNDAISSTLFSTG